MIIDLLNKINSEKEYIRRDISVNESTYIQKYLQDSDKILTSSELTRDLWGKLDEDRRLAFYLFILIHETNLDSPTSNSLLHNIGVYLPFGSSQRMRLGLFNQLSLTNVQAQYIQKLKLFKEAANKIFTTSDYFITKSSLGSLLTYYFANFILKAFHTLCMLGQGGIVSEGMTTIIDGIEQNDFVLAHIGELLPILNSPELRRYPNIVFENLVVS